MLDQCMKPGEHLRQRFTACRKRQPSVERALRAGVVQRLEGDHVASEIPGPMEVRGHPRPRRVAESSQDARVGLDVALGVAGHPVPGRVGHRRPALIEDVDADGEELHQLPREVLVRLDAVVLGNVPHPVLEVSQKRRQRVLRQKVLERAKCAVAQSLLILGI